MTDVYRLQTPPIVCPMGDGHDDLALFDTDDLPLDFGYEDQLWHVIVAIAMMGPAYILLFILSPLIVGLCVAYVTIWVVRLTHEILRRLWLRLWRMVREILRILFGV